MQRLLMLSSSVAAMGGAAPFTMQNQAGTTVTNLGGDEFEITKTAGDGWGNASATSVGSFAGDFIIRFTPMQAASALKQMIIGVTSDPLASNSYETLDHAFFFTSDVSSVYENNVTTGVGPVAYASGDHFFIKRSGTTLTYGHGGTDGVTGFTSLLTRETSATLYVDGSTYHNGVIYRVKLIS